MWLRGRAVARWSPKFGVSLQSAKRKTVPYLICDHPKRENIALLRGGSVFETGKGGVQQLRCQVLEVIVGVIFTLRKIKSKGESIVSETGVEITVYENVCLCDSLSGGKGNNRWSIPTGLRRLWIMRME